ncbi:hypothetical protein BC834DRAFT_975309 [Gloeopeniophorella convolvens]|nr:hypothetical protein BC834DRAFT_975309 [Gloeopeniophorella convolvens]
MFIRTFKVGRGEPLHIDWLPDGKRLFSTLTELHPLHYFILQALVEFGLANFEQLKDDDPHGKHSADLIRLIDEVILHAAVAIFLPSPQPRHRNPGVERYLAFSAFLHLCRAHYRRSELTLQHCDLDSAITCYRHLLCMREDPRARRTQLSADFARLVRWKYDLSDPIGGPEHVDVLLALYINCLPYRRLDNDLATVLETLVGFVHDIWRREIRSMYAQQVANHLRDVRQTCPSMYRPRMSIMLALMLKYSLPIDDTSHLETTESIRSLVQENFPLISPGDILRHLASHSLGDALAGSCTGSEGSTVSIDRLRVKVAQAMRPLRAHFLHRLAEKLLSHHDQFGDGKFLEESSRCMQELRQRPDDARYTMFGEIVIPSKIELGTTTGPFSCRIWLERMGSRIPDHQPSDHGLAVQRKNIEHLGAMAASTSARTLCTNSDQDLGLLIHSVLLLYSDGSPDDLDVCINVVRNFLDQPTSQRQYTLRNLLAVMCLQRFERLHQQEDLDECLSMFEAGSGGTDLNRAWKMGYLVIWAHVARRFNHPSTRLAYETYMRVMQRAVEWWPALQAQHATFRSGEALGAHALLDYASYQIEQGQLEAAVETIEQDKSLRRSTKRAQAIVSHDQEPLSDPKYLPTLASFNVLQTAASGGPVIIINHSQWRCDILIILPNRPPHRIPTSDGFYEHINMLSASLSSVRVDYGLDSQRYERTLRRVLRELYQLVGSPVMHALRRLGIPEQSRVWWCPTSALNTLPLHAMGPVPSIADDNCARYFSDIYVCSYTPALGALLDSRMSRDLTVDPQAPSLLPVDSSQMAVSELDALNFIPSMMAEGLVPGNATRATVIEGPRRHAGLEDGDLSGTSFRLNEGVERPTLLTLYGPNPWAWVLLLSLLATHPGSQATSSG